MQHGTCPACRYVFLEAEPAFDLDDEASDEDSVPGEDNEDDAKQPFVFGPATSEDELRAIIIPDDHEDLKKLSDEDIKEVYDIVSLLSSSYGF